MSQDKIFADGFIFKRHEKTPEWVIGNMSIKVDEAIAFLKTYEKNGWVNVGIKTAKETGKFYIELDTFEPKPQGEAQAPQAEAPKPAPSPEPASDDEEDLPF